ncbi:hypothetical protein PG988_016007 [Apiospora saccharicola]
MDFVAAEWGLIHTGVEQTKAGGHGTKLDRQHLLYPLLLGIAAPVSGCHRGRGNLGGEDQFTNPVRLRAAPWDPGRFPRMKRIRTGFRIFALTGHVRGCIMAIWCFFLDVGTDMYSRHICFTQGRMWRDAGWKSVAESKPVIATI